MKKTKFILGVVAAAIVAMTGCELGLNNADDRASESGYDVSKIEITTKPSETKFVINSAFSSDGLVVTATYKDNSTADVSKDVSVSTPDMTSLGTKTVTVSYAKTSLGETCAVVTTTYEIEVTREVSSIALKEGSVIYSYNNGTVALVPSSAKIVVTYNDNTTSEIDASDATWSAVSEGQATATYQGKTCTVSVTDVTSATEIINLIGESLFYKLDGSATGVPLCGYTGTYTSTSWWTEVSSGDKEVAVDGMIQTVFKNNSYGESNWSGTVYRIADSTSATEFAVCRNDNYGWGTGYYEGVTLDRKDIAWDGFPALISGSTEYVTVVNKGTTVDLYLYFVKDGAVVYYQTYKGIQGDGNAIQFKVMADAGADITYCE